MVIYHMRLLNPSSYLGVILLSDAYCLKFLTSFDCDLQAFLNIGSRRDVHSTYHSDSLITYAGLRIVVQDFSGKHLHRITAISISTKCCSSYTSLYHY